MRQITNTVLMIKPKNFGFNEETAKSNPFQNDIKENNAIAEFDNFVNLLEDNSVQVLVFEDTPKPKRPDAIFPNWISTHQDGTVILYPMLNPSRRKEVRKDIITELKNDYKIKKVIDLTNYAKEGLILEGTSSMCIDRVNKIAYAGISPRTTKKMLKVFKTISGYKIIEFNSKDRHGNAIYHTDVIIDIGKDFAIVCKEAIINCRKVIDSLENTGHKIIEITLEQYENFAGNMVILGNNVFMSSTAYQSLTAIQKKKIEQYVKIHPINLTSIEKIGGGSARCMITEIFLEER
jgi:hypothetical protein